MEKNVYSLNELAFALRSRSRYKTQMVTVGVAPHYFALFFVQRRRADDAYDDRDWY